MVGVVAAIGHDDVVHELQPHQTAGVPDTVGEVIILSAGAYGTAGVVMTNGNDRGVVEYRLADDDADIDGDLGDAAVGNLDLLDEPVSLVEQ